MLLSFAEAVDFAIAQLAAALQGAKKARALRAFFSASRARLNNSELRGRSKPWGACKQDKVPVPFR